MLKGRTARNRNLLRAFGRVIGGRQLLFNLKLHNMVVIADKHWNRTSRTQATLYGLFSYYVQLDHASCRETAFRIVGHCSYWESLSQAQFVRKVNAIKAAFFGRSMKIEVESTIKRPKIATV